MPLLKSECEKGFNKGQTPVEIIDNFFSKYMGDASEKQRIDLLFKFIQYIERQVVLFDAVERCCLPDHT